MQGFLSKVRNRYTLGFAVALLLGLNLLLFSLIGYVAASVIAAGLGNGQEAVWDWFLLSGIVWVPLAVGTLMPTIVEQFGPAIRDRREAERKADLARFVERV